MDGVVFSSIRHSLNIGPTLVSLLLGLAGCGGPLSTASSIRVEVDVYKGPLALELDTQWAELLGVVNEAKDSFQHMKRSFPNLSNRLKNCTKKSYDDYVNSTSTEGELKIEKEGEISTDDIHCYYLYGIRKEIDELESIRNDMLSSVDYLANNTIRNQTQNDLLGCQGDNLSNNCIMIHRVLRNTSEVAVRLKAKAIFWSQLMLIGQPESYTVRINIASFSSAAAQYSNQLSSRADALLKQIHGKRREVLPTSVYLRDTSPTDFPNLHAWNRAAAPALLSEMVFHPLSAFGSEETFDRIRVIERLFADHYWTNINTVYGSGQGTVRMALIKDDIGNWDLKSFDSDPTELVEAYKDVTLAAIEAAAELAADTSSGGATKAVEALDLASRVARGRMGSDGAMAGRFNVEALHERVLTQLQGLKQDVAQTKKALDDRKNMLTAQIEAKDEQIGTDEADIEAHESKIKGLEDQIADLETKLREAQATPPPTESGDPAEIEADLKAANEALAKERTELSKARIAAAVKREERKNLTKERNFTQEKLDALPASIIVEMQSLIGDHEAVIDVLQESAVAKRANGQAKPKNASTKPDTSGPPSLSIPTGN